MTELEELEARIRNLPGESLAQLREWFYEFENEVWDRQIETDYKAGKFAGLIDEARKEFKQGKAREL
ncbi:MAG TPA: hypothetical protein VHV77_09965 [Pirellulales bacterium]|nr:hypothetical protein [Pirellulales bacterium]